VLNHYFSNRLEALSKLLREHIANDTRPVLEPVRILVPTAAMQRYLTLDLARNQGIAANLQFDYLAQWLWEQMGKILPARSKRASYDASILVWHIYGHLSEYEWATPFPRLTVYLEHCDPVMRFELAQQIATTFEQYLTYRPEWLDAWANDKEADIGVDTSQANEDAQWQAALWRLLCEDNAAEIGNPAELLQAALADIHTLDSQTIYIFALPTLAPLHLQMLGLLSQHMEVKIYVLNPCQEYWFDVVNRRQLAYLTAQSRQAYHEEGNRLLSAWGQQTKASLRLLMECSVDSVVEETEFISSRGNSVLEQLQNSILNLTELTELTELTDLNETARGSLECAANDRSLEVHVCHSLAREIEILQARLLGLFAQKNQQTGQPLLPHDIVVVTPDIDAATPLIDAVFGTAQPALHIPYTITGRARSTTNAPARALLDLLALLNSRCTVNAVFGFLQQDVVARRFGLDADDLQHIHDWLHDAGAHWALDGAHRESHGVPAHDRYTFKDALDRLFAGYAMPAQVQAPFADILPAGDISGHQAMLLGALSHFIELLQSFQEQSQKQHSPAHWLEWLSSAIDAFVLPERSQQEDLHEVHKAVQRLGSQWRQASVAQNLPLDLVRAALVGLLDDPIRGGVPTGMVTFTSMSSLRNLPYRVVCAIGLNDGIFPSANRPCEFDLMAHKPRAGDRQRRIDERNLFLDLMLSAREVLHLSYVGRSVRDNSPMPPSVVIAELIDALSVVKAPEHWLIQHPLQAFSEIAFRSDTDMRLRSFNQEYAQALAQRQTIPRVTAGANIDQNAGDIDVDAENIDDDGDDNDDAESGISGALSPFFASPLPPPPPEWHTVTLDALVQFYRNPCRYLLERRLELELPRTPDELEDDEPLLPGGRVQRALAGRLLPVLLQRKRLSSLNTLQTLARAGTELPSGALGDAFLARELHNLQQYADRLKPHLAEPILPVHSALLECQIDGARWQLSASFADLRPNGLVGWRYAEAQGFDLLQAWIRHLMLNISPPPAAHLNSIWVASDVTHTLAPCDKPESAEAILQTLMRFYAQGLQQPLPFFPKTSWAFVAKNNSWSEARKAWQVTQFNQYAESADAAYRLALRGLPDPIVTASETFAQCARDVYSPLLQALAP